MSPDGASEIDVTSFDGTVIRAHWFPNAAATAAKPLPVVLKGPGWSGTGDTNLKDHGSGLFVDVNILDLHDAGYSVLTWDPRGFGKSTGNAMVDDTNFEGKDVQALVDYVATQPGVQLDNPGDPRLGMVGGSYGGTIQLILASIDCRVDAITPTIAWHSLITGLDKNHTYKAGWGGALYNFAKGAHLDPHIHDSYDEGTAHGQLSDANAAWFQSKGPGDAISKIDIPTLFLQGTVDTLFTLDEAVTNYTILKTKGVPVAMSWYCGGHSACLTLPGDLKANSTRTMGWLKKYLAGDDTVDLGSNFLTVDQNGDGWKPPATPFRQAMWSPPKGLAKLPKSLRHLGKTCRFRESPLAPWARCLMRLRRLRRPMRSTLM